MSSAPVAPFLKAIRSVPFALLLFTLFHLPTASAGPAEDANATVDRWSAAYTSNDPEAIVKYYTPDAILLGTVSPIMSVGTDAIRTYFGAVKGTGNKNTITDRRTIVLSDNSVVVTGFYVFTRMKDGQASPSPSRFTMLLVKNGDGEWRIAHHHSSPHVQPKS
ncbi:MAG TPA: SgcJ/EcaC family oxidoreductase [Usitatibacter sp.]|nr:SgcJ/EcaC family oxidoreductase [Usitatibacter sp.]